MAASAHLETTLAAHVAGASQLSESASQLLSAQIGANSTGTLPAFAHLCSELVLPLQRSARPSPDQRLPARILSHRATEVEKSYWKAVYAGALHEVLTVELVESLADVVVRALGQRHPAGAQGCPHGDGGLPAVQEVGIRPELPASLEVGAGSGLLSLHLARRLQGVARVLAADTGSSLIRRAADVEVAPLDYSAALDAILPTVVRISCNMTGNISAY